jgi:hypothetical protein
MQREIVLSHVVKDLQNAALDALRAKDEQAHSKLEQLRAQMRGKQYAYDHTGEVTLVSAIEPHKLPKPMVAPLYKTCDGGTEQCGTGPKALEKPGASICTGALGYVDGCDRRKLADRVPRAQCSHSCFPCTRVGKVSSQMKGNSKGRTIDFVERPPEGQPSPLDTMQLASGVTLKTAGGVKAGPRTISAPNQMTRADFLAFKQQQDTKSVSVIAGASAPKAQSPAQAQSSGQQAAANTAQRAGHRLEPSQPAACLAAPTRADEAVPSSSDPQSSASGAAHMLQTSHLPSTDNSCQSSHFQEHVARHGSKVVDMQLRCDTDSLPAWVQDGKLKHMPDAGQARRLSRGEGSVLASAPDWGQPHAGHYEPPSGLPVHKPDDHVGMHVAIIACSHMSTKRCTLPVQSSIVSCGVKQQQPSLIFSWRAVAMKDRPAKVRGPVSPTGRQKARL